VWAIAMMVLELVLQRAASCVGEGDEGERAGESWEVIGLDKGRAAAGRRGSESGAAAGAGACAVEQEHRLTLWGSAGAETRSASWRLRSSTDSTADCGPTALGALSASLKGWLQSHRRASRATARESELGWRLRAERSPHGLLLLDAPSDLAPRARTTSWRAAALAHRHESSGAHERACATIEALFASALRLEKGALDAALVSRSSLHPADAQGAGASSRANGNEEAGKANARTMLAQELQLRAGERGGVSEGCEGSEREGGERERGWTHTTKETESDRRTTQRRRRRRRARYRNFFLPGLASCSLT